MTVTTVTQESHFYEFLLGNPKAKDSGRQAEYDMVLTFCILHLFCWFLLPLTDSASSRPVTHINLIFFVYFQIGVLYIPF
jgi:hypothetical protein